MIEIVRSRGNDPEANDMKVSRDAIFDETITLEGATTQPPPIEETSLLCDPIDSWLPSLVHLQQEDL